MFIFVPNPRLDHDMHVPSPTKGQERIDTPPYTGLGTCPAQLHIESWHVRTQRQGG